MALFDEKVGGVFYLIINGTKTINYPWGEVLLLLWIKAYTAASFKTKTTGSQAVEEAVEGSCTFHPFVYDATNVGRFLRKTDQQHGSKASGGFKAYPIIIKAKKTGVWNGLKF